MASTSSLPLSPWDDRPHRADVRRAADASGGVASYSAPGPGVKPWEKPTADETLFGEENI